jgi:hypothetical protein
MIWFRSANSHTGPQLHRCIRGRTDGSIRQRANLLKKPLALAGRPQMSTRPKGDLFKPLIDCRRFFLEPARPQPVHKDTYAVLGRRLGVCPFQLNLSRQFSDSLSLGALHRIVASCA